MNLPTYPKIGYHMWMTPKRKHLSKIVFSMGENWIWVGRSKKGPKNQISFMDGPIKGDDIIVMVMLKFCQNLVVFKLSQHENLEKRYV